MSFSVARLHYIGWIASFCAGTCRGPVFETNASRRETNVTLQQLRYVIEIASRGAMSAAATALFISQPSLSEAIRELESELGISLFLRTNRGTTLTTEGAEFLGYARQVVEQADLLEQRYKGTLAPRREFAVSTQHYAFAVNAFARLVRAYDCPEYEFTLRETRTHDIIEDVRGLRSEVGVLYLSGYNEDVLRRFFREASVTFTPLFRTRTCVFVGRDHPLAGRSSVSLAELDPYPCLSYEQGTHNSFYFSEEILSSLYHGRVIRVSDRATLFNLAIGLNGYTIATGILSKDLADSDIVPVPLDVDEHMEVGYIARRGQSLSRMGSDYVRYLQEYLLEHVSEHPGGAAGLELLFPRS